MGPFRSASFLLIIFQVFDHLFQQQRISHKTLKWFQQVREQIHRFAFGMCLNLAKGFHEPRIG